MSLPPLLSSSASTIGLILGTMAILALIEAAAPLHAPTRRNRTHLAPNLTLTFITLATNIVFNIALVLVLVWLQAIDFGLLNRVGLPSLVALGIVVLALDFSFYVAHVAMHKVPAFWRCHRVHHSDPAVDVTTTIRQHPVEGVIRYAFLAAFAIPLGASPSAFAFYRIVSALAGLLEHANIRIAPWFDNLLSLAMTWPNLHKVHHSRLAAETDSNYGNIFSFWDRLFFTFTPSHRGAAIDYGLDGFDDPSQQTTAGLLAAPFQRAKPLAQTNPVELAP